MRYINGLNRRDPSRPVQYEGGGAMTAATDIICPMYARVEHDLPVVGHQPDVTTKNWHQESHRFTR